MSRSTPTAKGHLKDLRHDQAPVLPQETSSPGLSRQAVLVQGGKPPRLRSLDAFRGLTIFLMLLVNNMMLDTDTPLQLNHAPWHVMIRIADLVFPWFLLCVGIAIPFAAASFNKKGLPSWRYDVKVIGRTVMLIVLGCLVESSVQHRPIFSLGVLQIIGLAYLVAAFLYDLPLSRRMLLAGGLLFAYWGAMVFMPVPGAGIGVVNEQHNLIQYLNQTFFGNVQIGNYKMNLWGLPSLVPTAVLVLIGTAIGDILRNDRLKHMQRVLVLAVTGVLLMLGGVVWSHSLYYNKSLWTPSYIILTAGIGVCVLVLFYLITDIWSRWGWWIYLFTVFGSNAILAYVAPILIKVFILESWRINTNLTVEQWMIAALSGAIGRIPGRWLYTVIYISVWWLILLLLHRKKVYLRI